MGQSDYEQASVHPYILVPFPLASTCAPLCPQASLKVKYYWLRLPTTANQNIGMHACPFASICVPFCTRLHSFTFQDPNKTGLTWKNGRKHKKFLLQLQCFASQTVSRRIRGYSKIPVLLQECNGRNLSMRCLEVQFSSYNHININHSHNYNVCIVNINTQKEKLHLCINLVVSV